MEQRTDSVYPSAPLEKNDIKQRLEKNDVNSFNSSFEKKRNDYLLQR